MKRVLWHIGRIAEVLRGKDANVRSAVVRAVNNNQKTVTLTRPIQTLISKEQWSDGSEAAGGGGAVLLMAPPPVILFCLLVWDACHVVGTTFNDRWSLRNKFGWMGALQAPQQFNGKVVVEVQGARHLEAPKNLHLMVPKSRSIIAQQYVDGYAFFHVHCSKKSQENPKGPTFLILKFFYQKKMCMFYSSSWTIFLKFKSQAI